MKRALASCLAASLCGCLAAPRVGDPIDAGLAGEAYPFSRLAAEVFTPTCGVSQCHAGAPPPLAPMSLEEGKAYASLLAPSIQVPTLQRVAPGDPAQSYILHKLKGTAGSVGGSASRMPLGQPMLSDELIGAITLWIERGAPND